MSGEALARSDLRWGKVTARAAAHRAVAGRPDEHAARPGADLEDAAWHEGVVIRDDDARLPEERQIVGRNQLAANLVVGLVLRCGRLVEAGAAGVGVRGRRAFGKTDAEIERKNRVEREGIFRLGGEAL